MTPLQQKTIKAIVNVFETGRVTGNYSAIAVLPNDKGHLSYGRSQSTLGSGSLFELLTQYCVAPGAQFAAALQPYLPRVQSRDFSLDSDSAFRRTLSEAGFDPVMRAEQDRFFDAGYFDPACSSAVTCGLKSALSNAVVYDSWVHGHWESMRAATNQKCGGPPVSNGIDEQRWVSTYVDTRKAWLFSIESLRSTVYRMEAFRNLIDGGKWDLLLPFEVHGVTITEAELSGGRLPAQPVLRLTSPATTGSDVKNLQAALQAAGFPCGDDGAFTSQVEKAVRAFQAARKIEQDGIAGPATWAALA